MKVKLRYWSTYLIPSEYPYASQALATMAGIPVRVGAEEILNGLFQTEYRFTRKRDAEKFSRLVELYRGDHVRESQRVRS